MRFDNVVILTGAGISAESGIQTFRDPGGIWDNYKIDDICTPSAWGRNKQLVQQFHNTARQQMKDAKPNTAHTMLTSLQEHHNNVTIITQNIDDLHEKAGSTNVIHVHGNIFEAQCEDCTTVFKHRDDIADDTKCRLCGSNNIRPHVVWFEEQPHENDAVDMALVDCDLLICIGTSGCVYPAAGFATYVKNRGGYIIDINKQLSFTAQQFDQIYLGDATKTVPLCINQIF